MAFVAPLTVLMLILPTVLKLDEIESVAAENELPAFPGVIVNGLSPDNITCPNTAAESVTVDTPDSVLVVPYSVPSLSIALTVKLAVSAPVETSPTIIS